MRSRDGIIAFNVPNALAKSGDLAQKPQMPRRRRIPSMIPPRSFQYTLSLATRQHHAGGHLGKPT
jgi:hypothetical protein